MNHRHVTLLPAKAITADAVETIDLDIGDPLSGIMVNYKGLNASNTPTEHPAKLITKAEIIDGGFVIASLSGMEGQALNYWMDGVQPINIHNYVNDEYCTCNFFIPFGRWLWDPDLALLPSRFHNPQLRVTVDLNGGGSAPDAGILEVYGFAFQDKKITPAGYLRNIRWRSYSLVSSAYENVELPTDDIIKMLIVLSSARTKQPYEQFNEIRLSEDADKQIPIDQNTSDLIKYVHLDRGPIHEHVRGIGTTTAVAYYFMPTYETGMQAMTDNSVADYAFATEGYGGKISIDMATGSNFAGLVRGYCPHGSVGLRFGDDWDPMDWYDARGKKLVARIKAGSSILASSTCELVLQTMRKY